MLQKIKTLYNKLWAWCKNSGTILLARMEMISGLLVTTLGTLDWTALLSFDIETTADWKKFAIFGGVMFVKGLIAEITRRRGTVEVNNRLLPAEATKTEIKAIEVKK